AVAAEARAGPGPAGGGPTDDDRALLPGAGRLRRGDGPVGHGRRRAHRSRPHGSGRRVRHGPAQRRRVRPHAGGGSQGQRGVVVDALDALADALDLGHALPGHGGVADDRPLAVGAIDEHRVGGEAGRGRVEVVSSDAWTGEVTYREPTTIMAPSARPPIAAPITGIRMADLLRASAPIPAVTLSIGKSKRSARYNSSPWSDLYALRTPPV